MKTLHIDTGREMGGGQWQALYLIESLIEQKTGAVLFAPRSPLLEEARKRGLDARPLSLASLFRAARKADLIHAHDARAHTMAALARGAPLVVSRRVAFPMERGLLADVKYGSARLYLAVSKYAAERLHERGMPWSRIRVVYDGVPIPARATSATGGVVALAKNGPRAVLAAAASAGVPVHFVSDLWQDLSTASVFVYHSDMEGLGSAALAAMAAGVPVIASRVGGLPEIVEHERTGILMADDRELPQALRRLLDDPRAAAEMGRLGREVASEKFSLDRMVAATVEAYNEVLQ